MLTPLYVGSFALAKSNGNKYGNSPHAEDDGNGNGNGNGGGNGKPPRTPPAWGNVVLDQMNVTITIVNGTARNATDPEDDRPFNATIIGVFQKVSVGRWKIWASVTEVAKANLTVGSDTYELVRGLIVVPLRSGRLHIWVTLNNTSTGDAAKLILHGRLPASLPSPPESGTYDVDFLSPQSKLVGGLEQPAFFLEALNEAGLVSSRLKVSVP